MRSCISPHILMLYGADDQLQNTKHINAQDTAVDNSASAAQRAVITRGSLYHLSSSSVQVLCSNLPHVSPRCRTLRPPCYIVHTSSRRTPTTRPTFLLAVAQASHSAKNNKMIDAQVSVVTNHHSVFCCVAVLWHSLLFTALHPSRSPAALCTSQYFADDVRSLGIRSLFLPRYALPFILPSTISHNETISKCMPQASVFIAR